MIWPISYGKTAVRQDWLNNLGHKISVAKVSPFFTFVTRFMVNHLPSIRFVASSVSFFKILALDISKYESILHKFNPSKCSSWLMNILVTKITLYKKSITLFAFCTVNFTEWSVADKHIRLPWTNFLLLLNKILLVLRPLWTSTASSRLEA